MDIYQEIISLQMLYIKLVLYENIVVCILRRTLLYILYIVEVWNWDNLSSSNNKIKEKKGRQFQPPRRSTRAHG